MKIKQLILLGLFSILGISGCSVDGHVDLPYGSPDKVKVVAEDTILTEDYKGTQFIVINKSTLYAGDHTIDGRTRDESGAFAAVILVDGSHLVAGNIKYAREGTVIRFDLPRDWKQRLKALPQEDRLDYIDSLRSQLDGCSTVTDTNYLHNRVGIYVTSVNPCSKITNVSLTYGRLGIYHDAYSRNSIVTASHFNSVGRRYYSTKHTEGWIAYPYPRESVAIDGSSDNQYVGNMFTNGARSAINLYVNCGENEPDGSEGIPRDEPSENNVISGNHFKDYGIAIYNGSRHPDRKTYPCRADDKGDRVINTKIYQNTYTDVGVKIKTGN